VNAYKKIAVTGATGRLGRHVVDVLEAGGHDVVKISRSGGVDVITGEGLAEALEGVDVIVDAATGPTPDEREATEFFTTSARNLQQEAERAGVGRIVLVSIIGIDRFTGGYNAAKVAQEQAHESGSVPVRILRAAQFHEFVAQLVEWGTQGDVSYVWNMRTQLVAARTVAEELAALATDTEAATGPILEIAGPQEERLAEAASLLVSRRGESLRIEETVSDYPDAELYASGGALPSPDAKLAGPTYEEWLKANVPVGAAS
jgi:uncharacterized protein YbjT (DUF2867 family)